MNKGRRKWEKEKAAYNSQEHWRWYRSKKPFFGNPSLVDDDDDDDDDNDSKLKKQKSRSVQLVSGFLAYRGHQALLAGSGLDPTLIYLETHPWAGRWKVL